MPRGGLCKSLATALQAVGGVEGASLLRTGGCSSQKRKPTHTPHWPHLPQPDPFTPSLDLSPPRNPGQTSCQHPLTAPRGAPFVSAPDSVDRNLGKLQETVQDKGAELVCCSPSGYKEPGMTEQLNNDDNSDLYISLSQCKAPCAPKRGREFLVLSTSSRA